MSRPIERRPAPCIRLTLAGGLPHASGNVDFNCGPVRNEDLPNPIEIGLARCEVPIGKKHPDGDEILSWTIVMIDVSEIIAFFLLSLDNEARRIN